MTENSTSDVGRAAIDIYLDTVEQALIAAHAPRSDRVQVLHDLESQIADMLALEPAPLTEAAVQSVLAKLEPPSHFAAMYGNGTAPTVADIKPARVASRLRWSYVAAGCAAVFVFGWLLLLGHAVDLVNSQGGLVVCSIAFGFIATPIALAMAYWQLRANPKQAHDRNLVVKLISWCAIIGPALMMIILAEWTYGLVLVPLGAVAFLYFQYKLVQRLKQKLNHKLPPGPGHVANSGSPRHESAPNAPGLMYPAVT